MMILPRKLVLFILTACCMLCLTGCPIKPQQIAVESIEAAVISNDGMVAALDAVQAQARLLRKAEMISAAHAATSLEQGQRELDEIEERYAPIFEALNSAELIQAVLADGLEAAREIADMGEIPDLGELLSIYAKLQELYGSVLAALAEVRR